MEGGPKSLKAGRKLDEEGRDGEGTLEPVEGKDRCTTRSNYHPHQHLPALRERGSTLVKVKG